MLCGGPFVECMSMTRVEASPETKLYKFTIFFQSTGEK